MVEVRKNKNENSASLVRKFSTKVRLSGILLEGRKRLFYQKPLNKRARKEKALRRLQKISEAEQKMQ